MIDSSWTINTLYLWRTFIDVSNHDGYIITETPPTSNPASYFVACAISTSTPFECGNNWGIPNPSSIDKNVSVQEAPCPSWDCDIIITSLDAPGCDGPFDIKIATNAWSNTAGNRYWYFLPPSFRWGCYETYNISKPTTFLSWADYGWTDITEGNVILLSLSFPSPATQPTALIFCKDAPPTNNPSFNPTSIPTLTPSNHSTTFTSHPTTAPTAAPNHPTSSPTPAPSGVPTNPSNSPIPSPTQSPSASPSVAPTGQVKFGNAH